MRRLQKIQVDRKSTNPGDPLTLSWVPLDRLYVDDRYQRDTGATGRTAIRKIAAGFAWRKFSPVIVHEFEKGKYAIIDGQHRCTAALSIGIENVPCAIVNPETVAEAAEIFAAVNGDVIRMNIMALFKAARAAKVKWAVDVEAACRAAGVTPLVYPVPAQNQKPGQTNAIGRLRRIAERHGRSALEAVLRIVMSRPQAQVPGYINSKVIDTVFGEIMSDPKFAAAPLALVEQLLNRQPAADPAKAIEQLPAAQTGNALVVVPADKRREAFDRIQALKARNFTKSMVASVTKFRMSLINELWEGFTDAKP